MLEMLGRSFNQFSARHTGRRTSLTSPLHGVLVQAAYAAPAHPEPFSLHGLDSSPPIQLPACTRRDNVRHSDSWIFPTNETHFGLPKFFSATSRYEKQRGPKKDADTHTHARTQTHIRIHARTQTYGMHTCTCTHARTHTHAQTHIHTRTQTHTGTHARIHTRTDTHAHTRTYTHAPTQTKTCHARKLTHTRG